MIREKLDKVLENHQHWMKNLKRLFALGVEQG